MDPRKGGVFIFHVGLGTEIRKMMGIFLELSPPKKLRYTWHWEGSEEATEVSVEFGKEHGETRIQLEHQGFSNSEELNAHAQGWDAYIRGVEALINETGF